MGRWIKLTLLLTVWAIHGVFSQPGDLATVLTHWEPLGVFDGSDSPSGAFQDAVALDLDSDGSVFIVDRGRHRLLKFTPAGVFLREIGGFGSGAEQFSDPQDVDAHLTLNIFVADYNNNRIVRYDSRLNYVGEYAITDRESPFYFEQPLSVAVSGQYDLFVLEELNRRVIKIDRFNRPKLAFGEPGENLGQLLEPYQIAISGRDEIFVSDPGQSAVLVYDYLGNFLREIKHPDFVRPLGLHLTSPDLLLVADGRSRRVFFFRQDGRFLATWTLPGSEDVLVDVAMAFVKGQGMNYLYLLTNRKCWIFKNRFRHEKMKNPGK